MAFNETDPSFTAPAPLDLDDARPHVRVDSVSERVDFDDEPNEKYRVLGRKLAADALSLAGISQPDHLATAYGAMH